MIWYSFRRQWVPCSNCTWEERIVVLWGVGLEWDKCTSMNWSARIAVLPGLNWGIRKKSEVVDHVEQVTQFSLLPPSLQGWEVGLYQQVAVVRVPTFRAHSQRKLLHILQERYIFFEEWIPSSSCIFQMRSNKGGIEPEEGVWRRMFVKTPIEDSN